MTAPASTDTGALASRLAELLLSEDPIQRAQGAHLGASLGLDTEVEMGVWGGLCALSARCHWQKWARATGEDPHTLDSVIRIALARTPAPPEERAAAVNLAHVAAVVSSMAANDVTAAAAAWWASEAALWAVSYWSASEAAFAASEAEEAEGAEMKMKHRERLSRLLVRRLRRAITAAEAA